ncbi:MAG TPA: hypothetical protein VNQ78_02180 [Paracoccus sp. (in: a-proteobacteria)]|nr:hypothetical protein [Paracoccus sp. (in: a-proteobacteria)]
MRLSYTGIRQVLLATATDQAGAELVIASLSDKPLAPFVLQAQAACLDLLAALIKAGDDDAQEASSQGGASGTPMTLREYFEKLYQFATGWLGWSPSEVWNASPAEIEVAFLAHTDRLVKMTPGLMPADAKASPAGRSDAAQRQSNIDAGLDPEFDRHALHAMKARHSA